MASRGALIVLEGCDRVGKSTQCRLLVEALKGKGIGAQLMSFPNRSTAIGQQIDNYLGKRLELEDHTIHLLFSANRWEMVPEMKRLLESGVSLVVDRYAFSGVAFTAAKQIAPLSWCKCPEIGLPAPDIVFYLELPAEAALEREQFGGERYETTEFQERVKEQFSAMKEGSWRVLNAARSINDLHKEILEVSGRVIREQSQKPIAGLWTSVEQE